MEEIDEMEEMPKKTAVYSDVKVSLGSYWTTADQRYGKNAIEIYQKHKGESLDALKTFEEWREIHMKVREFTADDWKNLEKQALKG